MASSKSVEKSSPFSFPQVKASSEWSRLWHNNWVDSHTDRAVLCSGDWIQNRLLTHILNEQNLNKTLDLLNKNNYVLLLGDFNVVLTQGVETNLTMEE